MQLILIDLNKFEKDKIEKNNYLDIRTLDINFKIPIKHKSLIVKDTEIYLAGGLLDLNKKINNSTIYQFDFKKNTLNPKGLMKFGRNSFGMIYCGNFLFLVGGIDDFNREIRNCEKFCIDNNESFEVIQISSLQ